jgi:hypothetical protein
MSELLAEQVGAITENYGDTERGRLFGLIHRVCQLEIGRTMAGNVIIDWHNPRGRYQPSFRLLDLSREVRDDKTFRVNSFILDIPDDMTLSCRHDMPDDPLLSYVSDYIEPAIDAHDHGLCVPEPDSYDAQIAAYRARRMRLFDKQAGQN